MLPEQKLLRAEMKKFIKIDTKKGVSLFLIDAISYLVLLYGVLALPELWMKIIASVGVGIKVSNLATLAHDAGHNCLTKSKKLNKIICILSFLPGLINYRLWIYNHNGLHHPSTNVKFKDTLPKDNYQPYSKAEFDALSKFQKIKERLYRSPYLLGFSFYFLCERWTQVMLIPKKHMPGKIHNSTWRHFSLITLYIIGLSTALSIIGGFYGTSAVTAVLLGVFLPVFVFYTLMSLTLFMQHTNKKVVWHSNIVTENDSFPRRDELVSVQITLPDWLSPLMYQMHYVYDHGAHHLCPMIPCYEIHNAQERLNELLGEYAIVQRFSFSWLIDTLKSCKLYDYENYQWLDFNGEPSTQKANYAEELYKLAA